jgi:hypothetical protein
MIEALGGSGARALSRRPGRERRGRRPGWECAMPKDDFDHDDPFQLVGMWLPATPNDGALELMGRGFIEEFVRLGWGGAQILRLFQNPFYRGPHAVYRVKGEPFVRQLIAQVQQTWGGQA